jgi:beta-lactamase superfamily II metal-dependent hydrolase
VEIRIFDVEHGFCAYIIADNHNVMLIDCGYNHSTGFRPSNYLPANGCSGIERLIISNYDEDHLSDLPYLRKRIPIQILRHNKSISADELRRLKLKAGPIQPGMAELLDMMATYTTDVTNPPDFSGLELTTFYNSYPKFEDTNNLSLVTFIDYRDIHIVFPGDLEKLGWQNLLQGQSFRECLSRVNLFVASHHGRASGYCADVFDCCQPELVIISDESIQYGTQETAYRQHCRGISWGNGRRYVLTTRADGMITISQRHGEGPRVNTTR